MVEKPSLTYRLDFERGRIIGLVDGLEAVEQYIQKELLTPRYLCPVYDDDQGSEVKETALLGEASREFLESEMPRILDEALLNDERIISIDDHSFNFEGDSATVSVQVSTIYGQTEVTVDV